MLNKSLSLQNVNLGVLFVHSKNWLEHNIVRECLVDWKHRFLSQKDQISRAGWAKSCDVAELLPSKGQAELFILVDFGLPLFYL